MLVLIGGELSSLFSSWEPKRQSPIDGTTYAIIRTLKAHALDYLTD
jgi:hypothetical protein